MAKHGEKKVGGATKATVRAKGRDGAGPADQAGGAAGGREGEAARIGLGVLEYRRIGPDELAAFLRAAEGLAAAALIDNAEAAINWIRELEALDGPACGRQWRWRSLDGGVGVGSLFLFFWKFDAMDAYTRALRLEIDRGDLAAGRAMSSNLRMLDSGETSEADRRKAERVIRILARPADEANAREMLAAPMMAYLGPKAIALWRCMAEEGAARFAKAGLESLDLQPVIAESCASRGKRL